MREAPVGAQNSKIGAELIINKLFQPILTFRFNIFEKRTWNICFRKRRVPETLETRLVILGTLRYGINTLKHMEWPVLFVSAICVLSFDIMFFKAVLFPLVFSCILNHIAP